MVRRLKSKIKTIFEYYIKRICRIEYETQYLGRLNERPVEISFVFKHLSRIYPRKILDVGTGTTALPSLMKNCGFHVTAIDNVKDYWPSGMLNRHFHIIDDDITETRLKEKFDLITCISVLEHITKYKEAVRNMFSLVHNGGHIVFTFPYTERNYIGNVYALPNSSYDKQLAYICQSFSRKELDSWLRDYGGIIVDQEYWQFWDGKFWTEGVHIIPPRRVGADEEHQISCVLVKKQS